MWGASLSVGIRELIPTYGLIGDDDDYEKHANYIHHNPVKHGYVQQATEWPYSTIHDHIKRGLLSRNWGFDKLEDLKCGERV